MHALECWSDLDACAFIFPFIYLTHLFIFYLIPEKILDYVNTKCFQLVNGLFNEILN